MLRIAQFLEVTPLDLTLTHGLELREGTWWLEVREREACVFLQDDRCSIQEVKPVQCRTYPFWHEIVLEEGAWEAERAHCPGIGRGRGYTSAELEAMLNRGAPTDG